MKEFLKIIIMKNWFIRTLGLRGSWKWAQKQLLLGKVIRPRHAVSVKYRLDKENQQRIEWTFSNDINSAEWQNAYIFLTDFRATDWVVFE